MREFFPPGGTHRLYGRRDARRYGPAASLHKIRLGIPLFSPPPSALELNSDAPNFGP